MSEILLLGSEFANQNFLSQRKTVRCRAILDLARVINIVPRRFASQRESSELAGLCKVHSKASAIFPGMLPGTHNRVLNGLALSFSRRSAKCRLGLLRCPKAEHRSNLWGESALL
jgi:hypothetical protein